MLRRRRFAATFSPAAFDSAADARRYFAISFFHRYVFAFFAAISCSSFLHFFTLIAYCC
jgi:hypothetical protein